MRPDTAADASTSKFASWTSSCNVMRVTALQEYCAIKQPELIRESLWDVCMKERKTPVCQPLLFRNFSKCHGFILTVSVKRNRKWWGWERRFGGNASSCLCFDSGGRQEVMERGRRLMQHAGKGAAWNRICAAALLHFKMCFFVQVQLVYQPAQTKAGPLSRCLLVFGMITWF